MGFFKKFFMVMGVIFTTLLLLVGLFVAYFLIADPFGLRALYQQMKSSDNATTTANYDHPLLTIQQEKTLSNLGLDVSKLPSKLTTQQINCAVGVLGETRAKELAQGAEPTLNDFLKAGYCLK